MSHDRIDALGSEAAGRLATLQGSTLSWDTDPELQAIVAEAASTLDAPIALVTLVLERTQYFRAHVGLPEDLAIARATDRDASFCQFVVRYGEPFEVADALTDARVPQELVSRYGIRAYLGVPVRVRGAVVGSLCTIDLAPRAFDAAERQQLEALGVAVSRRLDALADMPPDHVLALIEEASGPAMGEINNLLSALDLGVSAARVALADARPLAAIARVRTGPQLPVAGALGNAARACEDLDDILGGLSRVAARLTADVGALGALTADTRGPPLLPALVEQALQLSHHQTRLVGGARCGPVPLVPLLGSSAAIASAIAGLIGRVCEAIYGGVAGVTVEVRLAKRVATLSLGSPALTPAACADIAESPTAAAARDLGYGVHGVDAEVHVTIPIDPVL